MKLSVSVEKTLGHVFIQFKRIQEAFYVTDNINQIGGTDHFRLLMWPVVSSLAEKQYRNILSKTSISPDVVNIVIGYLF